MRDSHRLCSFAMVCVPVTESVPLRVGTYFSSSLFLPLSGVPMNGGNPPGHYCEGGAGVGVGVVVAVACTDGLSVLDSKESLFGGIIVVWRGVQVWCGKQKEEKNRSLLNRASDEGGRILL